MKTWYEGNTLETMSIAIFESCLPIVAVNYIIFFHTYLFVPRQCCTQAVFSSGSPLESSSEFPSVCHFFQSENKTKNP